MANDETQALRFVIEKTPACRVTMHYGTEYMNGSQRIFTIPIDEATSLLSAHVRGRKRWLGRFLSITDLHKVCAIDVNPVPRGA